MIYLAGIDTLVIGFYLTKFNLNEDDYNFLNNAKELAKAPAFKSSGKLINFKKIDLVMCPAGKKPYTYVLLNDDFTLKLAQKISYDRFPEIFIELRSQFLWRLGYKNAYTFIKEWVSTWAEIRSDVVSRADLSIDVKGFPDIRIENVVSRGRKGKSYLQLIPIQQGEMYHYGSKITGWVFGSGPLMIRIYDKLSESKKVHKEWFQDLWKQGGWDGASDVTRVEIQIRREFLKDFNVTTFESFKEALGNILRYITQDWFTLRKSSGDKNRSRWPVTPFWSEVQASINNFGQIYGLARGRIKEVKENVLIPQAAGLITSIGATKENFTLDKLLFEVRRHYRKKGLTIAEVIAEKKRRHSEFEDSYEPF
ncbi:MAG: hypothetical protein WA126_14970 [Thermodesulfovibrionales bacterium]